MQEEQASPTFGECIADGADPAFQSDGSSGPDPDEEQNASPRGPREEPPEAAAAIAGTGDKFAPAATVTPQENVEESEAVRLLDEELAELEKLMVLQRKKIDALGRLRRQWLTGERNLPDVPLRGYREAYLTDAEHAAPAAALDEEWYTGVPNQVRGWGSMSPPAEKFEHCMMPYVRFPLASPVVAMKMLSFRLKGGGRSSGSSSKHGGGDRSGFLTVFASLHADGMVRLRDSDGEEILSFDAGHEHAIALPLAPAASSFATPTTATAAAGAPATMAAATTATTSATPPAVGMTGDASEGDPVLVTAGADGTVRVHSLTVRYRGKRIAGGRDGKSKPPGGGSGGGSSSRRNDREQKQKQVPLTGEGLPESSAGDLGRRDVPHGSSPATARGIGITASFRVCLGSGCELLAQDERTVGAAADEDTGVGPNDEQDREEAQSLPERDVVAAVTSMDAYYHRAMAVTVVVAGYSTGGVRLFHGGNGTVLGSAEAEGGVLAVKRNGQIIAYSDGQDVRFANAAKLQRIDDRVCLGGWGTNDGGDDSGGGGGTGGRDGGKPAVTALAFDAVSPGILYVGSETGQVMAFNSKVPRADRSHKCLPAYRLPPPPRWAPSHEGAALDAVLHGSEAAAKVQIAEIRGGDGGGGGGSGSGEGGGGGGRRRVRCDAISTIRGYAIVSQGPLLSVYNTTGDVRLLFTKQHATKKEFDRAGVDAAGNQWVVAGDVHPPPKWFVMPSSGGDVLVAETARFGAEMSIYRGTLPHERNVPDMGWMRVPVIILGLFVVAITQVYSRRKATSIVGNPRKPGGSWSNAADDGVDDMSAANDDDEDFGGFYNMAGVGRRLGARGTAGGQDCERFISNQSLQESPQRGAPPSQRYDNDLWERDMSD